MTSNAWVGNKAKQAKPKGMTPGRTSQVNQVILKTQTHTIQRKTTVVGPKPKPVLVAPPKTHIAVKAAAAASANMAAKIAIEKSMRETMRPVFITGDELLMIQQRRAGACAAVNTMFPPSVPKPVPRRPVPLPCRSAKGFVGAMNAMALRVMQSKASAPAPP